MRLVHNETGEEVKIGHAVVDFRNEPGTVTGWREPKGANSTGRIEVGGWEFYPDVFNCKWIEREDVPFAILATPQGAVSEL
jgi:hypothetical protein